VITPNYWTVHLFLQESGLESLSDTLHSNAGGPVVLRTRRMAIQPRGPNQQNYVRSIQEYDINFGIGPAGTGKTYLAVACAVDALEREQCRIMLVARLRLVKLGFLPVTWLENRPICALLCALR
jgi:phosphate starvation-inducible PhoH-like protein